MMNSYRTLGRTGLKITPLGLGCGSFGGVGSAPEFFGGGESQDEAFTIMDMAWELGINWFDSADAYGGGRSESFIGRWLERQGSAVRDRLLISTKAFNPVGDDPNQRGLSRRHLHRQVEASRRRLGVERIDMYLIHEPDPETPLAETLGVLDDLVHQGLIHYLGASNMPAWLMTKALWLSDKHHLQRFEWVQNNFSLLELGDEREMLELCADQDLGYTPFSPLAGGFLTGKYRLESDYPAGSRMTLRPQPYLGYWNKRTFAALERLQEAAGDYGVSMAGLALAWLMHHPRVTAPIIGPRRPAHFDAVREALSLTLTPEQHAEIRAIFERPTPTPETLPMSTDSE